MSLKSVALNALGTVSNGIASISPGRGLDYRPVQPVGWYEHSLAVDTLLESFQAVPSGERVRLAKKTSNLFRGRSSSTVPGLNVDELDGVIEIDPVKNTADVQGMCTYEELVDATLAHGLAPFVVPQLKTITLGGAVTGMGVESTSFRNGLPHESVLEMDVLTGSGEIVTCSPDENQDLFRGFPNSYGSLGYAVRLKIELEEVDPYVELRHVRYHDVHTFSEALGEIAESAEYEGVPVHGLDSVVFSPEELYIVLATKTAEEGPTSDYTREHIYYRSIQHPEGTIYDRLTIRDYIWRWDVDWFWASRAFGAQNSAVRKVWPRDLLRSSFYWKLIGLDRKYDVEHNLTTKRAGEPHRERVVQDIEVTVDKLPEWLTWFFESCDIQPMWLCPIRLRDGVARLGGRGEVLADEPSPWPLYPLQPGATWINAGFWSAVPGDHVSADAEPGAFNKVIEAKVHDLGGHKSLYSEAFYTEAEFEALYGGKKPDALKAVYDPDGRFPGLYDKTVGGA